MLFNETWELKNGVSAPSLLLKPRNRWFISDTHFFHSKLLSFQKDDGHRCRTEFSCIEEMNEIIVERWNALVRPGDKVWHLGDVALGLNGPEYQTKLHPLLNRLMGRKDLIVGNHDKVKNPILQNHFRRFELWKRYADESSEFGFTLSHIPQRLDQLRTKKRYHFNLHGHIHDALMKEPWYINVCCEHTNYAPVHLDQILALMKERV
jgi:calcineurin-like phosphoesterase family protein